MKKLVNFLLLLLTGMLLHISQHITFHKVDAEVCIEEFAEKIESDNFQFTTFDVGLINTAENRVAQNTSPVCETKDTDNRRQHKQKILEALSIFQYTTAKVYAFNEHISSKRQPYFHSIITENRQLRL